MVPKITFDLRVKASFVLIRSVPLIPEIACIFRLMSYDNEFTAKAQPSATTTCPLADLHLKANPGSLRTKHHARKMELMNAKVRGSC